MANTAIFCTRIKKTRFLLLNTALVLTLSACGGGSDSSGETPAPIANAGPDQSVNELATVSLQGSTTGANNNIGSYEWTQTAGTNVTISSALSAQASFIAPDIKPSETLTFSLLVSDSSGRTDTDTLSITVNHVNNLPIVSAGIDISQNEQTSVSLAGTASDTDGTIDSISWTQLSGSSVSLVDTTNATITFDAPDVAADETLVFEMSATDDEGGVTSDVIEVDVLRVNIAPSVAIAGNATSNENTVLSVLADATDPDGSIVNITWEQLEGPDISFSDATSATTDIILPLIDTLEETVRVSVTVEDNEGATATAEYSVKVEQVISTIRAAMLLPSNAKIDEAFLASASGSSSNGARPLQYSWSVSTIPTGSLVGIAGDTARSASLTANTEGEYVVRLTVSDGTASDSIERPILIDLDGDGIVSADDIDIDGDGVINEEDEFPTSFAKYIDSDGNGVTNEVQVDEDFDGTPDLLDDYPFDNSLQAIVPYLETEYNGNLFPNGDVVPGALPLLVSGAIEGNSRSVVDNDYFLFSGSAAQLVSFVLEYDSTNSDFAPVLTIIDTAGAPLTSVRLNLQSSMLAGVAVRLPSTGQFAAIVGDTNNQSDASFTYQLSIFQDSDFDGLSDEKELALGSLPNSPDSDFDGVSDFNEIILSSLSMTNLNLDIDNDGLPNYWDSDSDNDGILDKNEGIFDVDGDDIANLFDIDSDGNGINDGDELGADPVTPSDTDNDLIPNFLDLDDDNDAIVDRSDPDDLNAAPIAALGSQNSTLSLTDLMVVDPVTGVSRIGDARVGESIQLVGEGFGSTPIIIVQQADISFNIVPVSSTLSTATFELPNALEGLVGISVFNGLEKTEVVELTIQGLAAPFIVEVNSIDGGGRVNQFEVISIIGDNFPVGQSVSISFAGTAQSAIVSNSTTIPVTVPANATSGDLTIVYNGVQSNPYPLFIRKVQSGHVVLPTGSALNITDLDVEFTGVNADELDSTGRFSLQVQANETTSISVFAPAQSGERPALMLAATVLGNTTGDIVIDAQSTAIDLLYSAIGVEAFVPTSDLQTVLVILADASTDFAAFLDAKIGADPYYLRDYTRQDFVDEYVTAIRVAALAIDDALATGTISSTRSISKSSQKIGVAGVFPQEEQEDFLVRLGETGDAIDGTIDIENDTAMFADVQVISANSGKIIRPFANAYFSSNLIGPQQGIFGFYNANAANEDLGFIPGLVTLYSPGFDNMPAYSEYYNSPSFKLVIRTLISQAVIPVASTVIDVKFSDTIASKITYYLFKRGVFDGLETVWTKPSAGGVKDGFVAIFGKFTTSILEDIVQITVTNLTAEEIAKLSIKLGLKFTPFGSAATFVGAAGTAIDLGKLASDLAFTDSKFEWKVTFPVTVDSVQPTAIINDNSVKRIAIVGKGLQPVIRKSIFGNNSYRPSVIFEDANGLIYTDMSPSYDSYFIAPGASAPVSPLYANLPVTFINNATSPIRVKVKHKRIDEDVFNDDLVEFTLDTEIDIDIIDELTITSISPNNGAWGEQAIISGAGFSAISTDNTVYFSGNSNTKIAATIISASESELVVIVPQNTVTGGVFVDVIKNSAVETSNSLIYTIEQSTFVFTYGDNGAANDDTFALYINSIPVSTMPAPTRALSHSAVLPDGIHNVELHGITAPDAIGTYYIRFPSAVTVLSGDNTSGSDLTAGVVKSWQISVTNSTNTSNKTQKLREAKAFVPEIIWDEPSK